MNRKRKKVAKKTTKKAGNQNVEDWDTYMDLKKRKLMAQFDHDKGLCTERLSDIFKGVAIFVNGLTRPSAEELKGLMTRHGGVYHTYQVSTTTHIVASNLAHAKMKHIGSVPIVKPQWITESIDMQKLLDYKRYLLFTNQSTNQPRLQFPVIPKPTANAPAHTYTGSCNDVSDESRDKPGCSKRENGSLNIIKTSVDTGLVLDKQGYMTAGTEKVSSYQIKHEHCEELKREAYSCESDEDIFANNSPQEQRTMSTKNIRFPEVNIKCSYNEKSSGKIGEVEMSSEKHDTEVPKDTRLVNGSAVSKRVVNDGWDDVTDDIFGCTPSREQSQDGYAKNSQFPEENEPGVNNVKDGIAPSLEIPTVKNQREDGNKNSTRSLTDSSKIDQEACVQKDTVDDDWRNISDDLFAGISLQQEREVNHTDSKCPEENEIDSSSYQSHVVQRSDPLANEAKDSSNINALLSVDVAKTADGSSTNKRSVGERTNNVAKTAADPAFLKEFYNNSRLHLISTLSAEFKQLVVEMREKSDGKFPGKDALIQKKLCGELPADGGGGGGSADEGPVIMHIDMDCFFVSVGLRTRPHLRGRPVAVTHGRPGRAPAGGRAPDALAELELRAEHSDRLAARSFDLARDAGASMSEVASCSYEARRRGVRNGMFLGTALRLCPDLQVMPYDFQAYREVARALYRTVALYTLDVEAVSCDELYADCTRLLRDVGVSPAALAAHLRSHIHLETGCTCSAGSGATRVLARLATASAKPAGQRHVAPGEVEAFLATVPLAGVPGVGPAALARLRGLGLATCGDVRGADAAAALTGALGRAGAERLRRLAAGLDDRPLDFERRRKTVSAEVNYGIRFNVADEAYAFLKSLSQEVFDRAEAINMRAKCVTLKLLVRAANAPVQTAKYLGHGICDALTKSTTLIAPLSTADGIFREVRQIYDHLRAPFQDLRGVGIHLTKLERKNKGPTRTLMSFCKSKSAPSDSKVQVPLAGTQSAIRGKEEPSDKGEDKQQVRRGGQDERVLSPVAGPSTLPTGSKVVSADNTGTGDKMKSMILGGPSTSRAADIDLEVLNALPEEIRREVIKEYQMEEMVEVQMRREKEDDGAGVVRCVSSRMEYEPPEAAAPRSPFHALPMEEVRSVVRTWTTSEPTPGGVDTEMLGIFCKELAELRHIEQLQTLVSFFYRILETKDCKWHRAYFEIVNLAQQGMVARYGSTLLVKRSYKCCKHC